MCCVVSEVAMERGEKKRDKTFVVKKNNENLNKILALILTMLRGSKYLKILCIYIYIADS